MKRIRKKFRDMKYRHKLTILLVTSSLVPMTMLALYSHNSMSRLVRHNEVEDTSSILEQTRESIDSQIEVYTGLINYLTYSPDIEEMINEKNMDNYVAYAKYTQIVDPLLTVPKSYHDAINQIQIFADSIKVRHEYTLVPMDEIGQEWWSSQLNDEVQVQWLVNTEKPEIAAVRNIYDGRNRTAVLCITLDYNKIFKPLKNIISEESGTMVLDQSQNIVYRDENIQDNDLADLGESDKILEQISKEYVAVNSTSQNTGWKFYLYKTKKSVEKSVYQMLFAEIPLIAGCVLIIFILGMAFSRLFTRKIEMLTENMDQVNHGSREVTVTSDAEDEVGVLIRSFRRMMGEIDRLISEVYDRMDLVFRGHELFVISQGEVQGRFVRGQGSNAPVPGHVVSDFIREVQLDRVLVLIIFGTLQVIGSILDRFLLFFCRSFCGGSVLGHDCVARSNCKSSGQQ